MAESDKCLTCPGATAHTAWEDRNSEGARQLANGCAWHFVLAAASMFLLALSLAVLAKGI